MNEKQAKRLRRAARAQRKALDSVQVTPLVARIRASWPALAHRRRGQVGRLLFRCNLLSAVARLP